MCCSVPMVSYVVSEMAVLAMYIARNRMLLLNVSTVGRGEFCKICDHRFHSSAIEHMEDKEHLVC